jgi:hypothetical protein
MTAPADHQGLHAPAHPVRFVTAAALFDGHDAAINIMWRILQAQGAEVVHLGYDRSVRDVTDAVLGARCRSSASTRSATRTATTPRPARSSSPAARMTRSNFSSRGCGTSRIGTASRPSPRWRPGGGGPVRLRRPDGRRPGVHGSRPRSRGPLRPGSSPTRSVTRRLSESRSRPTSAISPTHCRAG